MLKQYLSRRNVIVGGGVVGCTLGLGIATRGFGLLPEELATQKIFTVDGIAIRGTDPVAYFKVGKPISGKAEFSLKWNDAVWHFANLENKKDFEENPAKFAPAYGGFCAWAVAEKGRLFSTQPNNWAIVQDRLFLNYNDAIQERWDKDRQAFIEAGDQRWIQILKEAQLS